MYAVPLLRSVNGYSPERRVPPRKCERQHAGDEYRRLAYRKSPPRRDTPAPGQDEQHHAKKRPGHQSDEQSAHTAAGVGMWNRHKIERAGAAYGPYIEPSP